ncbi:SH3 domain-containing protein [Aureliella helgolandensis]|uniref:Bacterial SH3 domain protein n=1 Tax=Aureliella helgolandensis TaxID=2527968 RepID=A0A518G6U2_9BACT|nr:SH3 domain-containing protein [Aureliella helgolandensis]QDV24307.1 hypothetical protein Q31a_26230 [Aureliella helgolandensis]
MTTLLTCVCAVSRPSPEEQRPTSRESHYSVRATCVAWCIPLLSVLLTFVASSLESVSAAELLPGQSIAEQGIAEYNAAMESPDRSQRVARFARAELLFRQAIEALQSESAPVPADLWVAHGNAALQSEQIGRAIVAFQRALGSTPADTQARQNLEHARSTLPDWIRIEPDSQLTDTLFFWNSWLSQQQLASIAALGFLVAAFILAVAIGTGSRRLALVALLPLLLWCLGSVSSWISPANSAQDTVVVVADEVVLRSADSANSAPRINQTLPDGAELRLLSERPQWCEVEVDGRSGWIQSSAVERLAVAPK